MLVRDYMTQDVVTMRPLDSARAARALFTRLRIQQVPILARGKLVGIVTDRDLRDAFPAATVSHLGRELDNFTDAITLESIMTNNMLTVSPTAPIVEAAAILRSNRIGALPVVEQGKLVGILTRSDLLGALVDLLRGEGRRRAVRTGS